MQNEDLPGSLGRAVTSENAECACTAMSGEAWLGPHRGAVLLGTACAQLDIHSGPKGGL